MFYLIKIGLDSGLQAQIVSALSREKIPFIQTSNGLCVKGATADIAKALEEFKSGFTQEAVTPGGDLPKDVTAFIDSN